MKTTLNLNEELFRRAKKTAAERGVTLTSLIEQALRDHLAGPRKSGYRFKMRTVHGTKPPAVDPADRNALYELMEDEDWLR